MTDPEVADEYLRQEVRRLRMRVDELELHFAAVSQVVDHLETQTPPRNPVSG